MMRSVGRVRSLVGALLIGLAVPAAASVVLSGCGGDDRDAMTHVERLTKPGKRNGAVDRLILMFNDALVQAQGEDKEGNPLDNAKVKELLGKIVPPLAEVALAGDLEEGLQAKLLTMLADSRHEAATDALVKAIEGYTVDDGRPGDKDVAMNNVVRAVGLMKLKAAAPALIKLFIKMTASSKKAQNKTFYLTLDEAMTSILDPSWEDELVRAVDATLDSTVKDEKDQMNQIYWQVTAAKLLGYMKSAKAVPSLMKAVISPFKTKMGVGGTALIALIRIGKPALDGGLKVLKGEDKDVVEYSKKVTLEAIKEKLLKVDDKEKDKFAATAHVAYAATILASLGNADATVPLLEALKGAGDDAVLRAEIASELPKLPKSADALAAWKEVYGKTPLTTKLPSDDYARLILLNNARLFYDSSVADFVGADALELKGDNPQLVTAVQSSSLLLAIKLAKEEQLAQLDKLSVLKVKPPASGQAQKDFEARSKLLKDLGDQCKDALAGAPADAGKCLTPLLEAVRAKAAIGYARYLLTTCGDAAAKECYNEDLKSTVGKAVAAAGRTIARTCAGKDPACYKAELEKLQAADPKITPQEKTESKNVLTICDGKDAACYDSKVRALAKGDDALIEVSEANLAKDALAACKDSKEVKCLSGELTKVADQEKSLNPAIVDLSKGLLQECDGSKEASCLRDLFVAVDTIGENYATQLRQTKELVKACKADVKCYLGKLEDPTTQDDKNAFRGVKAAYMIAMLGEGNKEARAKLIELLPKMTNPNVLDSVVSVIDRLAGEDVAVADKLQAILDRTQESHDPARIRMDTALYGPVIARLRARVQ